MAKDFTKYSVEGIAQGLGKARLVQKIVSHYIDANQMNYDDLKEVWFNDLQGGKGVFNKLSEIDEKNERNYYIDAPIALSDGTTIAVCNQWGKENLANFMLHAGLIGYIIKSEGDETEETLVQDKSSSDVINLGWNLFDTDWGLSHALAFLIRHVMIVDGEVIEGELNWMQVAFDEYDEQGIEVRDVWDDVDDAAQMYKTMGMYDLLIPNSIHFLNDTLDFEQKARLVQILMTICAQDNIIKKSEYVALLIIAKTFFPGQEHEGVTKVFEESGITIEE